MATYRKWEEDIVDDKGKLLPSSSVEVRILPGNTIATIYSARDGAGGPKANPFTADPTTAAAKFFAPPGRYKITITNGTFSRIVDDEAIGTAQEFDATQFQLTAQSTTNLTPGAGAH